MPGVTCMDFHCRCLDAAGTRTEERRGAAWRLSLSVTLEADAAPLNPLSVLLTCAIAARLVFVFVAS